MRKLQFVLAIALIVAFAGLPLMTVHNAKVATAQAEPTGKLAEILARGRLVCGVNGSLPAFGFLNPDTGEMVGFDIDFCRAIAAAIFGEATADNLEFKALPAAERFTALQNQEIDVLIRNTTWNFTRDTDLKGEFGPITYYDGQGLLVRADLGVTSIDELNGASFCTQTGTTTEANITEAMGERGFEFELIPFETSADSAAGYEGGRCDVLTSDKSQLAALRANSADPSAHILLADTLSKEPLGPMWLQGDDQWGDIISFVVYALFYADENGITQENIDSFAGSADAEIRRFMGEEGNLGSFLGLSNDFAVNAVRAAGNYGEIYNRHIVPLGIPREGTLNAQWTDGGMIYAPPWQ